MESLVKLAQSNLLSSNFPDHSSVSHQYSDIIKNNIPIDNKIVEIFKCLLEYRSHLLRLEDYKSIEFEKFNDIIKQKCLIIMLAYGVELDTVSILLDKIKSVNFGNCALNDSNPLMYCCYIGNFDYVQLLVEKYNADIEYKSRWDTTAIMYSVQQRDVRITKYLYKKGAKLYTKTRTIDYYAQPDMIESIKKWEKKVEFKYMDLKSKYDQLKQNYDTLEQKYNGILNFMKNINVD